VKSTSPVSRSLLLARLRYSLLARVNCAAVPTTPLAPVTVLLSVSVLLPTESAREPLDSSRAQ
jgi:hypothetical protein